MDEYDETAHVEALLREFGIEDAPEVSIDIPEEEWDA